MLVLIGESGDAGLKFNLGSSPTAATVTLRGVLHWLAAVGTIWASTNPITMIERKAAEPIKNFRIVPNQVGGRVGIGADRVVQALTRVRVLARCMGRWQDCRGEELC